MELRIKRNWEKGGEGWDFQNIVFCSMGIFALIIWEVFLKIRINSKDAAKLWGCICLIFFLCCCVFVCSYKYCRFFRDFFFAKVVILFIHFNVLRQFFNITHTKRFYCIFCKGKKKKLSTFSLHILAKLIKRLFVLKGIL